MSTKDRRIKKTKKSIKEAMLSLIAKKSIEEITVTKLCKEADINRSTFYSYYDSPEECFEEIVYDLCDQILDRAKYVDNLDAMMYLEILFTVMLENKVVFNALWKSKIYESYSSFMSDEISKLITFSSNNDILLKFSAYGCFGLINDWLNDGCKQDYHELINVICQYQS